MRDVKRYISSWIMLFLFVVYQTGIVGFSHVHVVNGVVVIHSHLFAGDDHEHTENQVASLQCLCHFECSEVPSELSLAPVERWCRLMDFDIRESKPAQSMMWAFDLRGPPSVCFAA